MKSSQATMPVAAPWEMFRDQRQQLIRDEPMGRSMKFLKRHTAIVDDYFLASFSQSQVGPRMGMTRNPYVLIALGGYGRAEQCVHSDIDLLFLFEKKVPAEAEALVREVVYPLWDMGLEVGHATRSVKECLQLARKDFEVLTALLDARFLCGMSPLFHQLMEQLRRKLINIKPGRIIDWLVDTNKERHRQFGDSSYLLEPNLKEGQGGLRDYHTMRWIARIQSDIKQMRDLEYYGYLSHDEYRSLSTALTFIWYVRNRLHHLLGRKCDQLHLEHQTRLADSMGIKKVGGHLPVERLMGKLHEHMEFIKQSHAIFLYELDQKKRLKRKNKALKKTDVAGLKFNRGMLNFTGPEAILADPLLLLKIFLESALQKAPLNSEARRLVKEFGHLVAQPGIANSRDTMHLFEKILVRPAAVFSALNVMLDTGLLERLVPPFRHVINRIQFDQYHLYPVARHLLLTVRYIKSLGGRRQDAEQALERKIYREIKSKKLLLWAALLHDIGKGEPSAGHSVRGAQMARELLTEKGLPSGDVETVCFLVEFHLLLMKTATRRDINDEETAISLARQVPQVERLKMLYLLSVADARATGPKAWNDWTASLLRSLFLKTLNVLTRGELVSRRAIQTIEKKKERILEAAATSPLRDRQAALLKVMSPRYLLYTPSADIPGHMALFEQLGDQEFVWQIEKNDDDTRTVTICAKDRPGLIAKIAGVMTLKSTDILDVHIFTWRNNTALDIFKVKAPPDLYFEDQRWQSAADQLTAALHNEIDLAGQLADKAADFKPIQPLTAHRPQQVVIDNQGSSFFTIIEVFAWDFPGLLFRVADALYRCQLDIWVAKIATRVDQVVDVFYVRTFDGDKADSDEQEAAIRTAVTDVLQFAQ